jgi:hypothetical protein
MFLFCKPVSSKKRFIPHRKLNEDFSFTLFEKAENIPATQWELITDAKTVFLEPAYLRIIEKSGHAGLSCRYVLVYHKTHPIGVIYFQIVDFNAGIFGDLLNNQVESIRSKRMNIFERYIQSNRNEVLLRLFTCGNNLISGEYGFLFKKEISKKRANELVLKITDIVSKEEKLRGTISAILLKDFYTPLKPASLLEGEKYSEFFVEPNLVVQIPENVNSLSEYIGHFSKKYRNRAKNVFKSLEGIQIRSLDQQEIKSHEKELYQLYEQVFDKARFKLIKLPELYFSDVKAFYRERFKIKAFFLKDKIIAFASNFLMFDDTVEAHYIGLDYQLNATYNLYQNILYCMIEEAIHHKRGKVNLGRTAAEIKTTVGAKPEDLLCYIKPQNTISKLIQGTVISYLQPSELVQRNPFKEEKETAE